MDFVPNANNEVNQDHPPNFQALLQKIRRFRLPSEKNKLDDNRDTITLVDDTNPATFPIFTKHHHYQLLNLCEPSSGNI